jgi:trehalose synthase
MGAVGVGPTEVAVSPLDPAVLRALVPDSAFASLFAARERLLYLASGRTIWNVNSTARGGGVAEMLRSLVAYARGGGLDCRWLVIGCDDEHLRLTKRMYHLMLGREGDGGEMGDRQRSAYEMALAINMREIAELVHPGDVVILHDYQTAGLAPALRRQGAVVVWRCHIGMDAPNELSQQVRLFLLPYLAMADAFVFSRDAYTWPELEAARTWVIPPSIDPFSLKNRTLDRATINTLLSRLGLFEDASEPSGSYVTRLVQESLVPKGVPLVTQVARWDHLKDPVGTIRGFARHGADGSDSHLLVVGPDVAGVEDDPEAPAVFRLAVDEWRRLSVAIRARIHLACLSLTDLGQNALVVNALQRRSDIIAHKSLAEGFGLAVTEAMWKGRPVVAGRVGGIPDQIEDGMSGLLVEPDDAAAFGAAVRRLFADPNLRAKVGRAAKRRVRERFLTPRHLAQYADLLTTLLGGTT